MKITKHQHALLELTIGNQTALIDPGIYQEVLPELKNVVAIVITHLHDDHCFPPHIQQLVASHPQVKIYGTREVAEKLSGIAVQVVTHGDLSVVGEFSFEFSGDLHQVIHRSIPLVQNVAVTVNGKLFYPGDSYTFPEHSFEILACPASAPWLRISDLIDYLEAMKPKAAFPTHNALFSDFGHALQNARIEEYVTRNGGEFRYLTPGQSWV